MAPTIAQLNAIYKEYLTTSWKDLFSGIDPNDLQGIDTALWGNKPCCGGANSNGPTQYVGGKWHAMDCDALKPPQLPQSPSQPIDRRPEKSFWCECGASSTANPNCHATYCPAYKK